MKDWWKRLQEVGLTQTEEGVQSYFPRYANLTEAMQRIDAYGISRDMDNGGVASLFREAILARNVDLDPKLAHAMGYAITQRFGRLHAGENLMSLGKQGFDADELVAELGEHLDADTVEQITAYLTRNAKEPGTGASSGRLKRRIQFEENFIGRLRNKVTGADEPVRVADFYLSDPALVFNIYSRQMSGSYALAKMQIRDPDTGGLIVDGIKSPGDWQKLRAQVAAVGQKEGADIQGDLDNLDFLHSAITGTPYKNQNDASDWSTGLRMLRDYNFARLMGQVGFSQVPESLRLASQVGLKTAWQTLPEFRSIIKMTKNGSLGDELAEELDAIGAWGADWNRTRFYIEQEEFGTPVTLGADTLIRKVNKVVSGPLHAANRAVNAVSGMAAINATLQTWASRAVAVKFAQMALGQGSIPAHRLAALGLDEKTVKDILKEIGGKAKFRDGVRQGHKLQSLGIKEWHTETAASFEAAIYRMTRTMVLENDPGQMAKWMMTPLGRTILQFRSFATGGWTKATLQGLNMRDSQAALGFLFSGIVGALVYAGQTHLNLIGDPDREKKLKQRLSWDKLGLAGFSRTTESSLLPVPMDMLSGLVTGEAMFDMRSSGLTGTLMANPTADLFDNAQKAANGIGSALLAGDDYSREDAVAFSRILPFQRVMGFVQVINMIAGSRDREIKDFD